MRFLLNATQTEPFYWVMSKKQAAAQKAAWRLALSEGRVIRYTTFDAVLQCEQYSFVAYQTKAVADETLRVQQARIGRRESTHIDACIAPSAPAAA